MPVPLDSTALFRTGMDVTSLIEWHDYPLPVAAEPSVADAIGLRSARVYSPELRNYREVYAALPPGYSEGTDRYPVVYMHDGQNLFDPRTSYAGDWGLRESLGALAVQGTEAIVIGVANTGRRRRYEYSPFRDMLHGGGGGDRYLAFLVETVKPLVDGSFRTLPSRSHTVIAGSSLGGSLSLYGLYRHAGVFGAAAVQSPALWFAGRRLLRYVGERAVPAGARIHLDVGLEEGEGTVADARSLRDLLTAAGMEPGVDLSYMEEAGAGHNERAWGTRFRRALPFLLGNRESGVGNRVSREGP